MTVVAPFRALRYNSDQISFISRVVAPPYDVIEPEEADELRARDPHNVIRLILGKHRGKERAGGEYAEAARTLAEWRQSGVLVLDDRPAIYLCEQEFSLDGISYVRHGVICALLLEDFSTGRVLPHERTMAGPKADRWKLMEACHANLSQVFAIFSDPDGRADAAVRALAEGLPVYEFRSADGVGYRVWRVTDEERVASYTELVRERTFFIADGHHRYETALRYRDAHRGDAPPGTVPEDYVSVFCVSVRNAGLKVLPTHRLVKAETKFTREDLLGALSQRFNVQRQEARGVDGVCMAYKFHRDAICAYLAGGHFWILRPKQADILADLAPDRSPAWRALAVAQLHSAVLEPIFDIPMEVPAGHARLVFTQDVHRAFWEVESGRFDALFLLPPTPPAAVEGVARSGERMPPKSTFFYPKILSGLAIYPFEGGAMPLVGLLPNA